MPEPRTIARATMARLSALLLCALILAGPLPALAAKDYAPEIKAYREKIEKEREERDKKERRERRQDPRRRARPYQGLDEVYERLDDLVADHPELLSGGTYGRSVLGRELRWIRLSSGPGPKPEIVFSANIHAQELAAGQVCIALLEHLAGLYGTDRQVTWLVDNADIYFAPIMNPDGMERAFEMQRRFGTTRFIRKNENEVDLNRNFPYPADAAEKLKDSSGSPDKEASTYRGEEPLSEPETAAFIGFVEARDFIVSVNYHTSGGMILYSPGTFPDPFPDTELMREMALDYQSRQFDKYEVFPGIDLYPTIGAMDDYLYHRYGILSFTVEVGTDMARRGWIPRNMTYSPIFWSYNVYHLEREEHNNIYGARRMIAWAIELYRDPGRIEWAPSGELWVGEPPREGDGAETDPLAPESEPSPDRIP